MRSLALGLASNVEADDRAATAARIEDAAQHANGRRFSGAVRPEHAEDFALVNRERDVAHGDELSEAARQSFGDDHRLTTVRVFGHGCRSMVTKVGRPA